jgi:uncharacterized protein (DUF58 family)
MWLKLSIFILLFLLILCFVLFAQEKEALVFVSSIDKTQVKADEVITFKINIEGAFKANPKIELPRLEEDFDVVSKSESESISWQKGQAQRKTLLQFGLLPKKSGALTIGAAKLKVGLKEYSTEPITISVTGTSGKREFPHESEKAPAEDAGQITL